MKKSMLALAVLGSYAGFASAQSTVTLYGLVDVYLNSAKAGDNVGGDRINSMIDGGNNGRNGSRWGLRVSEDLGGGLKANAVIESGINLDTGSSAQGGVLFGRQAWVGLSSSSLGDVRLGRQYTPSHEVLDQHFLGGTSYGMNNTESVSFSGAPVGSVRFFNNNGTRRDNMVQYITPNFSGFTAAAYAAAGEGTGPRGLGGKVQFSSGPIFAGIVYETLKSVGGDDYGKNLLVAGAYDFGVAKVGLAYNKVDDGVGNPVALLSPTGITEQQAYAVSVTVPFGPSFKLMANAQQVDYKRNVAGNPENSLRKFGVTGEYAFSKRTFAYAQFDTRTGDFSDNIIIGANGANSSGGVGKQNIGVGMQHRF